MGATYLRLTAIAVCLATSAVCLAVPNPACAAVRRVPSQYLEGDLTFSEARRALPVLD